MADAAAPAGNKYLAKFNKDKETKEANDKAAAAAAAMHAAAGTPSPKKKGFSLFARKVVDAEVATHHSPVPTPPAKAAAPAAAAVSPAVSDAAEKLKKAEEALKAANAKAEAAKAVKPAVPKATQPTTPKAKFGSGLADQKEMSFVQAIMDGYQSSVESLAAARRKKREDFEAHCEATGYKPPESFAERSWKLGGGPLWFVPEKFAPWRKYDDPRGASPGGPFMSIDKDKARALRNQQYAALQAAKKDAATAKRAEFDAKAKAKVAAK